MSSDDVPILEMKVEITDDIEIEEWKPKLSEIPIINRDNYDNNLKEIKLQIDPLNIDIKEEIYDNVQEIPKKFGETQKNFSCNSRGETCGQSNDIKKHLKKEIGHETKGTQIKPKKSIKSENLINCDLIDSNQSFDISVAKIIGTANKEYSDVVSYIEKSNCKIDIGSLTDSNINTASDIDTLPSISNSVKLSSNSITKNRRKQIFDDVRSSNSEIYYKCNHCEKTFGQSSYLKKHVIYVHGGKKNHKCQQCCNSFSRFQQLQSHVKYIHENEIPKKCQICEKHFKSTDELNSHVRTIHKGQEDFKCELCDKYFSRSHILKEHINVVHEGQKNYKCYECCKTFSWPSQLHIHIRSVHGRNAANGTQINSGKSIQTEKLMKCDFCNKVFKKKNELKLHVICFHEEIKKDHQCDICKESFISQRNLKTHIQTVHEHTDGRGGYLRQNEHTDDRGGYLRQKFPAIIRRYIN